MFPFACQSAFMPHPAAPEIPCGPRLAEAAPNHVETPLGVVVFPTPKGERAEAVLDAEGVWRCLKLPVLDRVLNALHGPRREAEGDGPFGHAELLRVAAWLKGEARSRRP